MGIKPLCGECYWPWPFHAPWCSNDCRHTAAVAVALTLGGCATLSTADKAGVALCQLWQATNPPPNTADNVAQVSCDVIEVTAPWVQAAQLAAAKPNAQAAVDALVAHPPLSLAAPCIDLKNPYQQHEGE